MKFFESATVRAAIISGVMGAIAVMLAVWLPSRLDAPKLREDNITLKEELLKKNHEIEELQTLLVPFRTVAFQNFTGTEAERLSKLALKLNDIQKGLEVLSSDQAALKEKTNGMTALPDGRLKLGNFITGEPTILEAKFKEMAAAYDARDVQKLYEYARGVIQIIEASEKATEGGGVSTSTINPAWLADVYRAASDGARMTNHFDEAVMWAKKSIKYEDGGSRRAALVLSLRAADKGTEAEKVIRDTLVMDPKIVQEFRQTMDRVGTPIP